ncbi:MAG: hypothetical protein ACM3U2_14160 [Deltaproteobacteria bacterium]
MLFAVAIEAIFNGCEAALWIVCAIVVAVRYCRAKAGLRRLSRWAAAFFVLFGLSDFIEIQTGAWWRPPGLLLLKGACLVGLTWCFVALLRSVREK